MKRTITIHDEDFGPACKLAFGWISREVSSIDDNLIFIIFTATKISFTPLIATVESLIKISPATETSSIHKNNELVAF